MRLAKLAYFFCFFNSFSKEKILALKLKEETGFLGNLSLSISGNKKFGGEIFFLIKRFIPNISYSMIPPQTIKDEIKTKMHIKCKIIPRLKKLMKSNRQQNK